MPLQNSSELLPYSAPSGGVLDVFAILRILRKRIWLVFLTAFVFAAATAAVTLFLSPVYRATTQILIDPSVRQPFDGDNQSRNTAQDTFGIDSQIAVILSDSVLRLVVREHKLATDSEFGNGGTNGLMGLIFKALKGGQSKDDGSFDTLENKAITALAKAMTVKRAGQTFVINISVDSKDPTKAATLSRAIAQSYLEDHKRQTESAVSTITNQIDDRLVGLRERMRQAEARVQAFREKNNLQNATEGELLTEKELTDLSAGLTEAQVALSAATAKNDEIQRIIKSGGDIEAFGDETTSATIANLREQYAAAARTEANLLVDHLPSHPSVIGIKAQLNRLRRLIQEEMTRIAASTKIEQKVAAERVAMLKQQIDSSRSSVNKDSSASIELRELEADAKATRTLYENVLNRTKEIKELDQVVVPDARIISPAMVPEDPIWPKKKLMVVLAAVLGLLTGVGLAVGGEAFRQLKQRFLMLQANQDHDAFEVYAPLAARTAPELQMRRIPASSDRMPSPQPPNGGLVLLSSLPPLADLRSRRGSVAGGSDMALLIRQAVDDFYEGRDNPNWAFGQVVDRIAETISRPERPGQPNIVMLTAPAPGQGQTTIAYALALAAARQDLHVLLADAEPRNRTLSHSLPFEAGNPRLSIEDRIFEDRDLGFSFVSLTSGQPKYAMRRMSLEDAGEFDDVARDFDLVIIDGPTLGELDIADPLVDLPDTLLLAQADGPAQRGTSTTITRDLFAVAGRRPCAAIRTKAVKWPASAA
ncbi:exopolysaccharide transport family protein [uncultured Roseibium sp.]|uniref:exopolysaccharide transport family protein n=1 Tax=uncultured Roseibium sp. TaxID=1936171 RepID=UPI00321753CF